MDFTLPEDAVAATELARTILREHAAPDRLARLELDGGWLDEDCWRSLVDAGVVGLTLPVEVGGSGLDELALHGVLHEVGANAAHVPLFETVVLGARAIDRAAPASLRVSLLERVVAGDLVLTAALMDEDGAPVLQPSTVAAPDGDVWRLTGTKTAVPCLPLAELVVVPASTPDGRDVLALVDADGPGVEVQAQRMPTDVPHGRLVLDGAVVPAEHVLAVGESASAALSDLVDHARAGLAAMQSGLVDEAVRLAASHTSQREQFGRPIATFQAVRQRVADARIAAEMLSLTSLQASWLLSQGDPATDELLIAAWWAAEAGHVALHAAHHVHGGIGVDREYPLHRLFGRAKSHEFSLGSGAHHLRDLGQRLAAEPTATPA